MSFWDFVKPMLPALVAGGVTLYGAKMATDASDKAANQVTAANNAATQAQVDALKTGQQNLEVNRNAASPGLLAMQELIARGPQLTPEQEMAVGDSRTQALNALKGSSLRGSARATAATVADVDTRTRNNFMTANQQQANTAASTLGGQYFSSGVNIANNASQQGTALSEGLMNNGTVAGANTIGKATVQGQAIGDIGATIADSLKDQINKSRDSSYAKVGA